MLDEFLVSRTFSLTTIQGGFIPLAGVSAECSLSGPFLSVLMRQKWFNSGKSTVEAIWHFPLPQGATLTRLAVERMNGREEAVVEPKAIAFNGYDDAVGSGKSAALLEVEANGILTMRLGNLPAGESMIVEVSWVQVVEETGGTLRVRIPTAIAPHYISADHEDSDDVPLCARLDLPWMDEVPYGISVEVRIADAEDVVKVESPSHRIRVLPGTDPLRVKIGGDISAMDRDFVLDVVRRAGRENRAWTEDADGCRYFAADIVVPASALRPPRKIAFLLDKSGSMDGESISSAIVALKAAIGALGNEDCFGLFAFSNIVWAAQKEMLAATPDSVVASRAWLDQCRANGGTELGRALELVRASGDWSDILVLTDGEIGDVEPIARSTASAAALSGTRLHILGIGSSPSASGMDRIARAGNGFFATVHPGDGIGIASRAISIFTSILEGREISVRLSCGDEECELAAKKPCVTGTRLRLFARLPRKDDPSMAAADRATTVDQAAPATLRVDFRAEGGEAPEGLEIPVTLYGGIGGIPNAISAIWSRERVDALLDAADHSQENSENSGMIKEAEDLAVKARILTELTSFLFIDGSDAKIEGGVRIVNVPVCMPKGYGANMQPMLADIYVTEYQSVADIRWRRTRRNKPQIFKAEPEIADSGKLLEFFGLRESVPPVQTLKIANASWTDVLALQVPGGGFSPVPHLLLMFFHDERRDYEKIIHCFDKGNPLVSVLRNALCSGEHSILSVLCAGLGMALLRERFSANRGEWEPLVRDSAALAGREIGTEDGRKMSALRWAEELLISIRKAPAKVK